MKVFITGGTGFIGTHVVKRLTQTDHDMVCLVRKTSDTGYLEEVGATLAVGDVTDKDSLIEGMDGCDWVMNLANVYSWWEPDKQVYTDVNVHGTRKVMESALETGVSKVVHISTAGIYGNPAECPFDEDCTPAPVLHSEYARTKREGDKVAWELYDKKGLPLVMIYPGGVLGAGDPKSSGQYINDYIHRRYPFSVFDDVVCTWVHVDDVAEVIVRAVEKEGNIGEKYLVGKHQILMRELNQILSEISGVPVPKLHLPDAMVVLNASLLTLLADIIKKPPILGICTDMAKTLRDGFEFDGSKVERELGITYTPLRPTLEEAVASFQK